MVVIPNSLQVLTTSLDATARVWDIEIGDCVGVLKGHTKAVAAAAVSASGLLAVTVGHDGRMMVWDLMTFEHVATMAKHVEPLRIVDLDHRDELCLTAGDDHYAMLWDLVRGDAKHQLVGHTAAIRAGRLLAPLPGAISTLAATAGCDFSVRLWDVETGACCHVLCEHHGWVVSLCVAHRPVGGSPRMPPRVSATEVVDADEPPRAPSRLVSSFESNLVRVEPDRRQCIARSAWRDWQPLLLAASHDGTATCWDANDATVVQRLVGHQGRLNGAKVL